MTALPQIPWLDLEMRGERRIRREGIGRKLRKGVRCVDDKGDCLLYTSPSPRD